MSTQQPPRAIAPTVPHVVTWRNAVRDADLSPNRRFLLLVLTEHMNADGWCWLSLGTIVKKTGLHKATVCRHLIALEDAGWIARKTGGRNLHGGKNTATEYTAMVPISLSHSPVASPVAPEQANNPPKVSTNGTVLGRTCDTKEKYLDLNQSQVLGVAPKSDATPTDELDREVERDEQTRNQTQEHAPIEEAQPPSTSNGSGSSSEPSSSDADFDLSKGDPPPAGYFKEELRRLKVPA